MILPALISSLGQCSSHYPPGTQPRFSRSDLAEWALGSGRTVSMCQTLAFPYGTATEIPPPNDLVSGIHLPTGLQGFIKFPQVQRVALPCARIAPLDD